MGSSTAIEWTDISWNPVVGCSKISPGCAHCYAETMAKRLRAMALADIAAGKDPGRKRHYIDAVDTAGRWTGKLIPVPEALADPLGWRKPRRIFVNSMSDLFHEDVPEEFIDQVFGIMDTCRRHIFQLLTKRADRMHEYVAALTQKRIDAGSAKARGLDFVTRLDPVKPLPNIWLGVSVERQQEADERIPLLLQTPAAVRFLSCEPLLGPIQLTRVCGLDFRRKPDHTLAPGSIDWVIVGGESGPNARPCDVAWIRSIMRQCKAADVPCFVKQLGSHITWDGVQGGYGDGPSNMWPEAIRTESCPGHFHMHLHDPKGGDPAEWPEDLRVRQFPEVPAHA